MERPLAFHMLPFARVAAQGFQKFKAVGPLLVDIPRPQFPDQRITARHQSGARSDRTPGPFLVEQGGDGFLDASGIFDGERSQFQEPAEGGPDIDEGNGQRRVAEFLGSVEQCHVGIVFGLAAYILAKDLADAGHSEICALGRA